MAAGMACSGGTKPRCSSTSRKHAAGSQPGSSRGRGTSSGLATHHLAAHSSSRPSERATASGRAVWPSCVAASRSWYSATAGDEAEEKWPLSSSAAGSSTTVPSLSW